MTRDQACAVYVVLAEVCGVSWDSFCEDAFIRAQSKEFQSEWRIGGKLGFGGKFWRNAGKWYVNCYLEDMTPAREKIIAEANEKLRRIQFGEDDGPQAA